MRKNMKNILITTLFLILSSCDSSQENYNINGTWDRCYSPNNTDFIYEELIINNTEFQTSNYNSLDNECTDIDPTPINRDIATLTIDNPHFTESGLYVYDFTLTNITRENPVSSISLPNWYSISYKNSNMIFPGRTTGINDGSSDEMRHIEINLEIYLSKK